MTCELCGLPVSAFIENPEPVSAVKAATGVRHFDCSRVVIGEGMDSVPLSVRAEVA